MVVLIILIYCDVNQSGTLQNREAIKGKNRVVIELRVSPRVNTLSPHFRDALHLQGLAVARRGLGQDGRWLGEAQSARVCPEEEVRGREDGQQVDRCFCLLLSPEQLDFFVLCMQYSRGVIRCIARDFTKANYIRRRLLLAVVMMLFHNCITMKLKLM